MKSPALVASILPLLPLSYAFRILSSPTNTAISSSSTSLRYRTSHEYEYGSGDDRVRALTSEDRLSVLQVLETNDAWLDVDEKKRRRSSKHRQHESPQSSSHYVRSITTAAAQPDRSDVIWDVDADRFSLASLLEPPAAPFVKQDVLDRQSSPSSTSRITTKTTSAITSLQSIQDYNHHILNTNNNQNQLKLIRFSAPWCQVCRTTNVAYERMVAKLTKRNSNNDVAFYSVSVDGRDSKNALKDHLEVAAVPTCIVYHPAVGIVGRITLNRSNLNELKKRLDGYVNGALHRQGEMMWMEALVMGLEQVVE